MQRCCFPSVFDLGGGYGIRPSLGSNEVSVLA